MQLLITAATPSESREIAALRAGVAADMTARFGPGHWSRHATRADVRRQMRASRMLVAHGESGIIGTVRLVDAFPNVFRPSAFTPVDRALYVLGLAVSSDFRKQGVGRQLLEAARELARERSAQALWLDAYEHPAGAGPFYLRCGFRRVGSGPGMGVPLEYYERSLADS